MNHSANQGDEYHCRVAVIGGGFTGTVLAAQLLRADTPLSVALIEPAWLAGRGIAYATSCSWHLLNVPVCNMSAFADDPEHFLRWARSYYDAEVQPEDFIPRKVYGQYVESVLREAIRPRPERFLFLRDEAEAIEVRDGCTRIQLVSRRCVIADRAVLALGNFRPSSERLPGISLESRHYIGCAWKINSVDFEDLAQEESILLVGSGLTAVDIVVGLRVHGFTGKLHLLSRHGLLPRGHEVPQPEAASWSEDLPATARQLLNLVRKRIAQREKEGHNWRCVIDSLRPVTAKIWQSLLPAEKRRFLRHVRPYWDVHRHRIAPAVSAQIQAGIEDGGIQIHAGRITNYHEELEAAVVKYRDRKAGTLRQLRVGRVINCTTPETDCRKVASPLLVKLLRTGLVRPDPLYLGLDAAEDGALVGSDGRKSDVLYTLGPALKGQLWESIAVPEIRVQAAKLTAILAERKSAKRLINEYSFEENTQAKENEKKETSEAGDIIVTSLKRSSNSASDRLSGLG